MGNSSAKGTALENSPKFLRILRSTAEHGNLLFRHGRFITGTALVTVEMNGWISAFDLGTG